MARHPGRGGRHAPRGPPRGFHAAAHHAHQAPYAAPPPPLPPHGGLPLRDFGMPLQPPLPYAPSPPVSPAAAALERDVASLIHSMRASRSDAKAAPNALNVRDAIQAICAQFGTAAYESLCVASRPLLPVALRALHSQHERVWSFVTCYRHARRVHTLYECHAAFLDHEGIRHFAELGIGNSFLHTDAVQSLYQAPSVIYRLTTMDVLSAFRQFEQLLGHDAFSNTHHSHRQQAPQQRIDREQFKQFIAQLRRQPSAEAMGLYIDPEGFGPYIAMLRRIAKKEQREIHELQDEFNKGIADRVFELSKAKFSSENRQKALAELLQRTHDERASELTRNEPPPGATARRSATPSTNTLASLSLEILNRVTTVDVYLDNTLRRKAADERYKARLAAHAIADTDQKIRTQLTPFLLATQKSRHHARVKVVTWVLCGVLAKIHTLLQLDDRIPEPTPSALEETKEEEEEEKEEDEGEECDCCCVGEDTCRCRCQCECHQDDSDEEKNPTQEAKTTELPEETKPLASIESSASSSPLKRKRSRSRSDSVVVDTVSSNEIQSALETFLSEQLRTTADDSAGTTEHAVKLLAKAESHVRAAFAGRSLGSFSLLEQVVQQLEAVEGGDADEDGGGALQQIVERLCHDRNSSVTADELRDFISNCLQTFSGETSDPGHHHQLILQRACVQFGLDATDNSTRRWAQQIIADVTEDETPNIRRGEGGSILHYASVLTLPESVTTQELALLEVEASRDQVLATKTTQARKALAQCPFLVDVGEWTQWRVRFAPFCGPLTRFLRSHELIRLVEDDDHACGFTGEFVVARTNDRVMKIRGSGDVSASALDAAEAIPPETLALELVSLCVQHHNDFPREFVLLHLRTILKRSSESDENGDRDGDHERRAAFVLETMLAVPHDFAAFVWGLLEEAAHAPTLESEVATHCKAPLARRQLQLLGEVLSKPKWKQLSGATSFSHERPSTTALLQLSTDHAVETSPAQLSSPLPVTLPSEERTLTVTPPPLPRLDASACEAFITKLRREQFGIGLEIADAATRGVLQTQHHRLERALKRLSDELYSEKTHFVLELLQNADDNTYPVGVKPRGALELTRDGQIVFTNNEIGFSESNIQAICDVGASTKAHDDATHKKSIGKKGIGFKSVFKVSDMPEVHSNGFHIQFHATQQATGLGYILPYWIEARDRWREAQGTTFVLPLNAHSLDRQREMSKSLLAFEPSVLLFLQKIQALQLTNHVTGGRLAYEKHERVIHATATDATRLSVAMLQAERVKHDDETVAHTTQRWFLIRRQLEIPSVFAEGRGTYTEIAIAVPELELEQDESEETQRPPLQQVFCYLPLRSYGFRFILQGDFEVPSSREAISNGSDWNQWLISQFPQLIPSLVALVTTQQLPLQSLLRVLPLDSDIQPPFRSIVTDMSRAMRQSPCFPTADGSVAMASELLDVSEFIDDDHAITFLTGQATLVSTALHKRVLDVEMARAMPAMLKAQLRLERLRASHVLRLLTHVVASTHDTDVLLNLLHLLAKLLRHDRHKTLLLQELSRLTCFPVRQGHGETWLSLADVQPSVLFIRSPTKTAGLCVEELRALGDDFTSQLETAFPETRRFLIEQLGLKELEDHDVAIHHILPAIATTPPHPSDQEKVQWSERVAFLASHIMACGPSSCLLRPLIRQAMRVVTWSGRVVSCQQSDRPVCVLLPSDAKKLGVCSAWLQQRLASTDSLVQPFDVVALDSATGEDALRALWVDCCQLPHVMDPTSETASVVLGRIVEWIHSEPDLQTKRQVSAELARYMDTAWHSAIDTEDIASAWWQRTAWLEASDGQFYRPCDLWVASSAVVSLFSRAMVPNTKTSFNSESLRVAWQLKTSPSVDDVLRVLQTSSETQETEALDVDVAHMTRLYTYLLEQSRGDQVPTSAASIRTAFTTAQLIYVPSNDDGSRPTRFVGVPQVVWSSDGDLVASVATPLNAIYAKTLRAFFVGVCGVERKPTIEQLEQELAYHLKDVSAMAVSEWTARVLPVLQQIAKALAKGKLSSSQLKALKKMLKRLAWIPMVSNNKTKTKTTLRLGSMQRTKEQLVAFPEDDTEREILRLCTSLSVSETTDAVVDFVAMDDADILSSLLPLLRLVGAVSVRESLLRRPAQWCRRLATLGADAANDAESKSRRSRKRYEKLLKHILLVWATAWGDRSDDSPLSSPAFTTELSTQSLFSSSSQPGSEQLHRGVDLFLNDQHELTHDQLQHPSLRLQRLFAYDHFVNSSSNDDTSAVQTLLLDAARMRSLAQHLETEVVLLGAPQPFADESFTRSFHRTLEIVQRVVFHHHRSSYVRLDHDEMHRLLSSLSLTQATGDLELVHRVRTTAFTLRRSVACYLDTPSRRVLVAPAIANNSPTLLFDVLYETSRQCFGREIATSMANVLYLASMQPTQEAREAWLVTTQHVPPLDARAGVIQWVPQDNVTVSDTKPHVSSKRYHEAQEVEDGEVSDDNKETGGEAKRPKVTHAWDQPHQRQYQQERPGWAGSDAYPTPAAGYHLHHQQQHQYGVSPSSYHQSSYALPTGSAPRASGLASLAFSGPGATTNGLSDAEKHAIGRWGEEYVFLQLQQSYADQQDVTVDWVNAQDESGLPYDIVVTTGTSHDVEYVEVKSTKTMEKGVFEISMNELDQAATHGSKYVIYRVFNAGNAQLCRVVRMKNPVALVRQKKIQLVLLMQ